MTITNGVPCVVRKRVAPQVVDRAAEQSLRVVLCNAAGRLSTLGQEPVAIGASPNRFDDAWNDEWVGVRCGHFYIERPSLSDSRDLDADVAEVTQHAIQAYRILIELERSGWRDLFAEAFGVNWTDQSLSLVLQDGMSWLVFSANNESYGEGDPVFSIREHGEIVYAGEAENRFDWAIQDAVPLVFRSALADGRDEILVPRPA